MHWVTFEGRTLPRPVGGHPALDLCNTYAGWGGPPLPRGEWLPDADALVVWCLHTGLLGPEVAADLRTEVAERPAKARRTLERVRRLRADLYATLVGDSGGGDGGDGDDTGRASGHDGDGDDDGTAFDRVAEVAQRSARAARLVENADGGADWVLPADLGLDLPLLHIGRCAADLLVSDERALVRACPGDECGWLFLDRRGTRRWCSMQTCGNRAKTKAFAARQRPAAG